MRRKRGPGGRFLSVAELAALDAEEALNPTQTTETMVNAPQMPASPPLPAQQTLPPRPLLQAQVAPQSMIQPQITPVLNASSSAILAPLTTLTPVFPSSQSASPSKQLAQQQTLPSPVESANPLTNIAVPLPSSLNDLVTTSTPASPTKSTTDAAPPTSPFKSGLVSLSTITE